MTNEDQPWSYDDDIPDGTDWEEILSDLRWMVRQYVTRSKASFDILEGMMLHEISGNNHYEPENLLQIAVYGQELSKPLTIYLNKINEYILRRREMGDKDEPET